MRRRRRPSSAEEKPAKAPRKRAPRRAKSADVAPAEDAATDAVTETAAAAQDPGRVRRFDADGGR
ncbi:hypothetical protein GCM10023065_31000 [Microbacterium laevaniformans]|uniref:hypothetical protein n=1 Tax=Microbacterium laevaniformans TaxID=36807 RepID=UPI0031EA30EE